MKTRIISAAVAAVIATWAVSGYARQAVALPGVVGPQGELNGVDTAGPGTLSVGNQNINTNNDLGGALTSTAADTGIVVFSGNSTVTGFTGTVGSEFLRVDAGAPAMTVNFNGAVFAQTFNVTGTGTVNFNGDVRAAPLFAGDGFINLGTGRTLTGAITTATANTGTLTLNNGSSVVGAIGGASGLKQINVVGGNASITGAVQTLGFSLDTNTLTIAGALTTNPGGTIRTTIASNSVFGNVQAGSSLINAAGITVIPTVTGVVTTGTNFRIVNAPVGTIGAPVVVVNNSPRYTFAGVPTTTGDVNIRLAATAPLATLVTTPGALAVAPILDITAAPGSDLLAVQNAIAVLPNAAAINNALTQLAPGNTNIAAPWVAGQATRLFEDMWVARMDEIQSLCCDTCTPKNSGTVINAHECKTPNREGSWWGKMSATKGHQRNVDNVDGYKTDALGLMLAYDMPLSDKTRLGFGGGYANTKIDGSNSSSGTFIDTYQLTTYLSHVSGAAFVQGALTVGKDNYDSSRSVVFPGVNRTASANYTGQQYTALVSAGKHYFFDHAVTVTPLASLQASRIDVDSYTESGAGGANLRVGSQKYNFLQSGLGVKAEQIMESANGTYSPEVHAKWLHDFSSTTMHQNAAFAGGGSSFSTNGIKQDRDMFNVGAGVTFLSCNCGDKTWTVKGVYDYKWSQSSYSAHQVSMIASMKF
jgi:uncharacterized protein with beta-barrel porin domain